MLTAIVVAVAVIAGVPVPGILLLGLALLRPVWFLGAVGVWAVRHRRRSLRSRLGGPDAEAVVLRAVAAELAAGASLRGALTASAGTAPSVDLSHVARLAAVGRPMEEIVEAVRRALPINGRRAAAALHLAGRTGAAPRRVLERLAGQAADLGALARERRVMTAQARLSAALVGGAPLVLLALLGVSGRLGGLVGDPAGRSMLGAGLALLVAGIGVVAAMVVRADR